jgi:cell division cycle 20-like protein 1 (cofactor of APC complex)
MSGLKNSPFGKRLRASHREPSSSTAAATDDDFAGSRTTPKRQGGGIGMDGIGIVREYGDRFVPSKDSGDLRTSYHLMEEGGGPSTPSKSRIIPSESDALKGEWHALSFIYSEKLTNL